MGAEDNRTASPHALPSRVRLDTPETRMGEDWTRRQGWAFLIREVSSPLFSTSAACWVVRSRQAMHTGNTGSVTLCCLQTPSRVPGQVTPIVPTTFSDAMSATEYAYRVCMSMGAHQGIQAYVSMEQVLRFQDLGSRTHWCCCLSALARKLDLSHELTRRRTSATCTRPGAASERQRIHLAEVVIREPWANRRSRVGPIKECYRVTVDGKS